MWNQNQWISSFLFLKLMTLKNILLTSSCHFKTSCFSVRIPRHTFFFCKNMRISLKIDNMQKHLPAGHKNKRLAAVFFFCFFKFLLLVFLNTFSSAIPPPAGVEYRLDCNAVSKKLFLSPKLWWCWIMKFYIFHQKLWWILMFHHKMNVVEAGSKVPSLCYKMYPR